MRRSLASGALALVLGACHGATLTAQQEATVRAFEACRAETGSRSAQIKQLAPDGRLASWEAESRDGKAMKDCLTARGGRRWISDGQALAEQVTAQLRTPAGAVAATELASPDSPGNAVFAGSAVMVIGHEQFQTEITLEVRRSGTDLSGRWKTRQGTSGEFSAVLRPDRLHSVTARQDRPCPGDFAGELVVKESGRRIYGHHAGRSCKGPVDVHFVADRWG